MGKVISVVLSNNDDEEKFQIDSDMRIQEAARSRHPKHGLDQGLEKNMEKEN